MEKNDVLLFAAFTYLGVIADRDLSHRMGVSQHGEVRGVVT
jgi:hypothetical protein